MRFNRDSTNTCLKPLPSNRIVITNYFNITNFDITYFKRYSYTLFNAIFINAANNLVLVVDPI